MLFIRTVTLTTLFIRNVILIVAAFLEHSLIESFRIVFKLKASNGNILFACVPSLEEDQGVKVSL